MTELRIEPYELLAAELGPENPLPFFRDVNENVAVDVGTDVPEDERRHIGWGLARRVLPHRMQDSYSRQRHARKFQSIVLENAHLRATFLPELGGRLVSLYHKTAHRELLEKNPVFQPANLALRNAWFSGGIEWNTSQFGHYFLTCSSVFAARATGSQGEPVLRLYEWDRVKCFPWQIDVHLPPDSPFLFTRVRLINPHNSPLPMYWWTNMAVPETPRVRVLAPADTAVFTPEWGRLLLMKMPEMWNTDVSYSASVPMAREFFFRIPPEQRRWLAAVDEHGKGLVQASTSRLRGRKLFVWGNNQGGRHWQEFLSTPGHAYLEIQAGLAQTQVEHIPMPPHAQWTWTEAFGLLEGDPAELHAKDWSRAWRAADAVLNRVLPAAAVDARDAAFAPISTKAPDEILFRGSGWGALEKKRWEVEKDHDGLPAELVFSDSDLGDAQQPWITLLEKGVFPYRWTQRDPGESLVQKEWLAELEFCCSSSDTSWLEWLHLGNARMENHDPDGARDAWERSNKKEPSAWALRNLAVLEEREGHPELALERLRAAWELGPQIAPLAIEFAQAMLNTKQFEALEAFGQSLPEVLRSHERIQILTARAKLETGRLTDAEFQRLVEHEYATIREGETTLTDIWFAYHERATAKAEGVPIDEALRQRVRRQHPPPKNIDFRLLQEIN